MKGAGQPRGQDDGVVKYESAHLEGIASEKIVRSTHSTQSTPATILEVRRILYEHLGIACGLECEVPERVEAAVAGTPKPEPPAVTTDPRQNPERAYDALRTGRGRLTKGDDVIATLQ